MLRAPRFKASGDLPDTTDGSPYPAADLSASSGIAIDPVGFGSASGLGPNPTASVGTSPSAASGAGGTLQFAMASGAGAPTVVSDSGSSGSSGPFDNISFAVNADAARQQFGVNGTGITIGIISTGFSSAAVNGGSDFKTAVADGLVDPNAVDVHDDNLSVSDEGLAMAEIVHEIALDAHIVFYTGIPTAGQSAQNEMATAVNVLSTRSRLQYCMR